MLKRMGICNRPARHTLKKCFLEVYNTVGEIALVLKELVYDNATIEDPFYCVPAWFKTCLFLCQGFLSLGLESVKGNTEQISEGHEGAHMGFPEHVDAISDRTEPKAFRLKSIVA